MPCRGCRNDSTTCIEAQKNAFFLVKDKRITHMLLSDPKHQRHGNREGPGRTTPTVLMLRDKPSLPRQHQQSNEVHSFHQRFSLQNRRYPLCDPFSLYFNDQRYPLLKSPVLLRGGLSRAAAKTLMVGARLTRAGRAIARASIGIAKLAGKGVFKVAKRFPTKKKLEVPSKNSKSQESGN